MSLSCWLGCSLSPNIDCILYHTQQNDLSELYTPIDNSLVLEIGSNLDDKLWKQFRGWRKDRRTLRQLSRTSVTNILKGYVFCVRHLLCDEFFGCFSFLVVWKIFKSAHLVHLWMVCRLA